MARRIFSATARWHDRCSVRCMLQGATEHEALTEAIIGCAIRVHEHFGPGLFESVYQRATAIDLQRAGLSIDLARRVPLTYCGVDLGCVFQPDLIVADTVVVELKAVDVFAPVHRAQLVTYLKLTQCPVGLIINFNVALLKDGIRRMVRPDLYRGRRRLRDEEQAGDVPNLEGEERRGEF